MGTEHGEELTDAAINDFLGRRGTAVLSLARDDTPYSIPVSYGYTPDERAFYLRLGFHPDSEKRQFVDASELARLVRYERTGDEWTSVIAVGELREVTEADLTGDIARVLQQADVPLLSMWDVPIDDVEFGIYRLPVDRLTGRRGSGGLPDEQR